jgi:predicted DNA-binding transcriptional regulator YafY
MGRVPIAKNFSGGVYGPAGTRPPLDRMLQIHTAIATGKYPNANTLARELEVSARSIARDLDFMRDRLQLPVRYDEIKHGYFYEGEVEAFPTLTISEGELFALAVAEKALRQYRGTSFEKPLLSAFRKMADSLPETISLNLNDWSETISFRTSAEPILNLETFDQLARATARAEQLRIVYRKPGQKKAEPRVVDPYHLANVNGEWYLFAYDHLREAVRTFSPARIVQMERTGEKFSRDDSFSVQEELKNSFGILAGTQKIRVMIRFDEVVADFIREKKWHASQKLREVRTGGVELEMILSSLIEVERWVLSWGGHAKVIQPAQLVSSVRAFGRAIAAAHAR